MAIINLNNQLPTTASDTAIDEAIGISSLGTPLYDDVTFPSGNYLTLEGVQVSYQELSLKSIRFVVTQQKQIVRTNVSGRNGNVKEYNNTGEYIVRCEANITTDGQQFPLEEMIKFANLKDVPESVPVVSKILNRVWGIDNVIINDWSFDPGTSVGNTLLTFTLESDREFDLSQFIINQTE